MPSGLKVFIIPAIVLAVLQYVNGLYVSYLIRVVNDIAAAGQILPVHAIVAVIFFIALIASLFRASKIGAGMLVAIPIILLIIQGIIGLVAFMALNRVIDLDLSTVDMIGLYVHHPLGLITMLTTIYVGVKLLRGGARDVGSQAG